MLVLTPVKGEYILIGTAKVWISDRGRKVKIDAPPDVPVKRQRQIEREQETDRDSRANTSPGS